MIAKKCDRCGALYERYNERDDKKKPNGMSFLNINSNQSYFPPTPHDLCPDCSSELVMWFNNTKLSSK